MTARVLIVTLHFVFFIGVSGAWAEMSSTNYRIPHSVLSSGGGYQSSASYEAEDTLGQSTPLMDDPTIPSSTNYKNYPGIWFLLAGAPNCPGNYDGDSDVDGDDLMEYMLDAAGVSLENFAAAFGRENCY